MLGAIVPARASRRARQDAPDAQINGGQSWAFRARHRGPSEYFGAELLRGQEEPRHRVSSEGVGGGAAPDWRQSQAAPWLTTRGRWAFLGASRFSPSAVCAVMAPAA
jgi:hypothetical protein